MDLKGVDLLLGEEIKKTKASLEDIDKTIAKLTGRNPNDPAPRPGQRRFIDRGGDANEDQGRPYNKSRRGLGGDEGPLKRRAGDNATGRRGLSGDGPPAKRRASGGAFSRLGPMVVSSRLGPHDDVNSGDDEELSKHTVHSSVVANPVSTKSREEVLESTNKDKESRDRNRRMLGVLMGTLQRFKKEEQQLSDKEAKRKAVEQKLEMKAKQEQENIKKERRKLFLVKQKKEQKIRRLEQKIELVKIHEEWAAQTKILGNFIRTKARPHLFYAPKTHTSGTTSRLKSTKELLEKIIKDRRKQLEEEIEELMHENDDEDGVEVEKSKDKHESVERAEKRGSNKNDVKHDEKDRSKDNKENELGQIKEVEDMGPSVDRSENEHEAVGKGIKSEQEGSGSKANKHQVSPTNQGCSHTTNESEKKEPSHPRSQSQQDSDDDDDGEGETLHEKSSSEGDDEGNQMEDENGEPRDNVLLKVEEDDAEATKDRKMEEDDQNENEGEVSK